MAHLLIKKTLLINKIKKTNFNKNDFFQIYQLRSSNFKVYQNTKKNINLKIYYIFFKKNLKKIKYRNKFPFNVCNMLDKITITCFYLLF